MLNRPRDPDNPVLALAGGLLLALAVVLIALYLAGCKLARLVRRPRP